MTARFTSLSLALLVAIATLFDADAAHAERVGLGAIVTSPSGQVVVKEVRPGQGADVAGITADDVITKVNGTDITDWRDASKLLVGDACTFIDEVTILKQGKGAPVTLTLVPRLPVKGDCFGYAHFKGKSFAKLIKVGEEINKKVRAVSKKKGKTIASLLGNGGGKQESMGQFEDQLKNIATETLLAESDVMVVKKYIHEIQERLLEIMPEGKNGVWEVRQIELRFGNETPAPKTGHQDLPGFTVTTPIVGESTRFHRKGCLATPEEGDRYKEFAKASTTASVAIAGKDRFNPWKGKDQPPAMKAQIARCNIVNPTTGSASAVHHERPEKNDNRLTLMVDLSFRIRN
jgi:hypothetical protein